MAHAWERIKSQVDKGFTSGQLSCDSTENSRERNFTGYWSYDKNIGEHFGKSVHICLFPKSIFTEEDLLEVFGTKEFCCFDDERQVREQFPELKQAVIIVEKLPWFIENNNKGTFQNNFLMKEIYI